jgi:histidinol-phosphate aminotransferase
MTPHPLSPRVERKVALEMICPYEPGKPIEEVRRELGLTRVIKLASNENPLGPSPEVIATLNRSNLELHMYPDYEGWYLREAISRRLGVPADCVVIANGSAELMRLLADAYLDRGDEGIVADICFPVYANAIRIAGATPVVVPLGEELDWDLGRVADAVTPRTKVVFVATPNNPTGRSVAFADLRALADRLPPTVLLVLDLAYCEYPAQPASDEALELWRAHPNVVLLRTFSKVYGLAGLRVGYGLAATEVVDWLGRVRVPFSTSTAAQVAARVALGDEEHVRQSVALNARSRDRLARELGALGLEPLPSDANFVLVNVRRDAEGIFQSLLRRGIIVRPMRGARLGTFLRITTGTEEQVGELAGAMREVLG